MKTNLKMLALFGAMVGALALQGCKSDEDRINIGAKSFGENRVLAHMVADLAKERGLPVGKVVEISGSQAIMDGLRRGDHELDRRAREARPTQRTSHTVDRIRTAQSESHVVTRWFEGP